MNLLEKFESLCFAKYFYTDGCIILVDEPMEVEVQKKLSLLTTVGGKQLILLDTKLTKSFDLLYKGLEVTSGAQREHRYEQLEKQIKEKGFKIEPFKSYLNFFKHGCPPHGGFAPGPTRILMKIFGLTNVREVTYLYRGVNRLTP